MSEIAHRRPRRRVGDPRLEVGTDRNLIIEYIDRRGWADDEAAIHLAVSRDTVRRWRSGERLPTVGTYDRIAMHLGRHPDELWGNEWAQLVDS